MRSSVAKKAIEQSRSDTDNTIASLNVNPRKNQKIDLNLLRALFNAL
jgi:hypothetical protein